MLLRRIFLAAAVTSVGWLAGCSQPQALPTKFSITAAQLQTALQAQFPKHFPVAGLLRLDMQSPSLQLRPSSNQLHAMLALQLSGAALPQSFTGHMEVSFGLRYEPSDRTVRAERVHVGALQVDDAPPVVNDMLNAYGPRLGEQALEQFVLYRVSDQDLQVASALQLQPGAITVTPDGLEVAIVHPSAPHRTTAQ